MIKIATTIFLSLAPLAAAAHEATPSTKSETHSMTLPAMEGVKPWSAAPVLNDPQRFQIAIMTDRTGGHRPGVWMDAVQKLNLLRPEFVVSVGDLIEGYTEDVDEIERQWTEFLGFIDQMQMRFFFVPGNHDVTNPTMHRIWREHFGTEWYSFDYRGVHFLCLNSEDPHQVHMSEKQLSFIQKDLAEHADARWTLVFLHKPLWTYAERQLEVHGKDKTNWKRVEAMLVDRPHTVFAGHVHHYVQYDRNGENYYSLATTGGGSQLRGNDYGEFDHVTWLTMEPEGPHVVNLRLDGILPPDTVTEQSAQRFGEFIRQVQVEVDPILVDETEAGFSEAKLRVRLVNNLGRQARIEGRIDGLPLAGLTVDPEDLSLSVGPTGSAEQEVQVRFAEPIGLDRLRRATLTAQIEADGGEGEATLRAERIIPVVIDNRFVCPKAPDGFVIDGVYETWPDDAYGVSERPLLLGAVDDWKGPADGSFELTTSYDDRFVYVRLRVIDEKVLPGDDKVFVLVDGRSQAQRRDDPRQRSGTSVLEVAAPAAGDAVELPVGAGWRSSPIAGAKAAGRQTESGYDIELALPVRRLNRQQDGAWESFQLAVVQFDADEPSAKPVEIVWRGSVDYRGSNENYARFYQEP